MAFKAGKNRGKPRSDETGAGLFTEKKNQHVLETALLNYIQKQRWYRGKARRARSAKILDIIPMNFNASKAYFTLIKLSYFEGKSETYAVPLLAGRNSIKEEIYKIHPGAVISNLQFPDKNHEIFLYDAMVDPGFCAFLIYAIKRNSVFKANNGKINASSTSLLKNKTYSGTKNLKPSLMKAEQSNTSINYGNRLVLKLYRKLEEGINPDLEIGLFLTEHTRFANIARVAGSLEYTTGSKKAISLGILQTYIPNKGDAWRYTLDTLEQYFRKVLEYKGKSPTLPAKHLLSLPKQLTQIARDTIGDYIDSARLLGQRTAELHLALASAANNADFAPEPFTMAYQKSLFRTLYAPAMATIRLLKERLPHLPQDARKNARKLIDEENKIFDLYNHIQHRKIAALRVRCHGDYHLGQVLYSGDDFFIIDFEGEPARPLRERRSKCSPLKDVAGMIRSFDYAVSEAVSRQMALHQKSARTQLILKRWAQYWCTWVSVIFLESYLGTIKKDYLLPEDPDQLKILLDIFILEKAFYEVSYELNNRPDWIHIPLRGILNIMGVES